MKRRARASGLRAPSKSVGPAKKRQRVVQFPTPRYRALANPMTAKVSQQLRCEMTYSEYAVSLDPGAGVTASYVFAANGLYDPNVTGAGHQPMGFDQIIALYNQYVVIGGIITVKFSNYDGAYSQLIGITMKDSSATSADPRAYIEWGNTTWDQVGQLSGTPTRTLKHKFDIAKFANQDIFNEQSFTGTSSSNPANTLHLVIWACTTDGVSNPNPVYATVEIAYDCIFRSPAGTGLS